MAGKTLINGTAYTVKGGTTKVNGIGYKIARGKTKIDGTAWTIAFGRLPSGYTEVEYIQSSGTQYINTLTNIQAKNIGFDLDFLWDNPATTSTGYIILGVRDNSTSTYVTLQAFGGDAYTNAGYTLVTWASWGNRASTYPNTGITQGVRNHITYYGSTGEFTKNDGTKWTASSRTTSVKVLPLYLFSCNENGTPFISKASAKVFSFKVYDGTNLVRDFVPCINPNNEVGMYDLVSQQFFGNSGTGAFIAGNPV